MLRQPFPASRWFVDRGFDLTVADLCRRDAVVTDGRLRLHEAAELLRRTGRWDIPVIEVRAPGARLAGILRAADLVASTSIDDLGWVGSLLVSDVMTTNVPPLREDDRVEHLIEWFQTFGISGAPVANDRGHFIGVVEFSDVVDQLANELTGLVRRPTVETVIIDLEDPPN